MTSTPKTNPATYGKLLAKMQPQPIHSEEDYDRAVEAIAELMERGEDHLSPEETSLLEMMSILAERYEQEHYPIEPSKPGEMIRFSWNNGGSSSATSRGCSAQKATYPRF